MLESAKNSCKSCGNDMANQVPTAASEVAVKARKSPVARPMSISLFCGAGGLDAGLECAGFSTVAAVDSDKDCIATLRSTKAALVPISGHAGRHYLEDTKIIHARIENVRAVDLRPANAANGWAPDFLAGGPPCQPFSSAGKQLSLEDPRGKLFEHFVRLADELRPKYILFENVRGLVTARGPTGKPGEALDRVKKAFEKIGYATNFCLLNAADFGAPQRRVRLLMLAACRGVLPEFPKRSHAEIRQRTLFDDLKPWVTLGEFLAARPEPQEEDIVRPRPQLLKALSAVQPGSGIKTAGLVEANRPGGHWGYRQDSFVADLTKPARTIRTAATPDWIRSNDGALRRLTWKECAALQSFPDGWQFTGPTSSKFVQIGNAVPAVLGQALGASILRVIDTCRSSVRPVSAALPAIFLENIKETQHEDKCNAVVRKAAKAARASAT